MKRHLAAAQRVRPLDAASHPHLHVGEEITELAHRIGQAAEAYVGEHQPPPNTRFTIHFETPMSVSTLLLVHALDAEYGDACTGEPHRIVEFVESNGQLHTFIRCTMAL